MRALISQLVGCLVFAVLIPLAGCGKDTTPEGPDRSELETYLDENPEAAARLDDEDEVEPDDEDESGEG